jgi:Family of unknown function (DUF6077)
MVAPEARFREYAGGPSSYEDKEKHDMEWRQGDLSKPVGIDQVIPTFVLIYAAWTVYVHATTAAHGSFNNLVQWFPLLLAFAMFICWRWFKLSVPTRESRCFAATHGPAKIYPSPLAMLAAATLWVVFLIAEGHYLLFWWGSVIALAAAWLKTIDATPIEFTHEPIDNRSLWVVCVVTVAAVGVTLAANRPDADDAFYLSVPATLLRLPNEPILLRDTIYRLAGLPIQLPVYRLHSYEALIGTLSRMTAIRPVVIAYVVLPSILAALSIVAWAQLLRLLAPKHWALVLVVLFFCVLALGETHHSYGNFAFVRMFQGKAILATLVVPCIIYLALDYSRFGNVRSWIALFAAQITAIGFSSSALFVAPAAAGLALFGAWRTNAISTRRLGLGILASSYVVVAAGTLASITHGGEDFVTSITLPPMTSWLDQTLGTWSTALLLITLLASWSFTEGPAQAGLLLTGSLCFLLTVLNPYIYQFVADHFTGPSTYWRLFWALPLPFMLAIMFSHLIQSTSRIRSKLLAAIACLALAGAAAAFFFHSESLRKDNHVSLGLPGLKVPSLEYPIAEHLAAVVPESGTILAPESIATWLPTFIVHPQILASRGMYLIPTFGADEGRRRLNLQLYVGGVQRVSNSPSELRAALARYALTAIVVTHAAPWQAEIAQVMSINGWHSSNLGPYDLWIRNN